VAPFFYFGITHRPPAKVELYYWGEHTNTAHENGRAATSPGCSEDP
jgi:hypothetical protein